MVPRDRSEHKGKRGRWVLPVPALPEPRANRDLSVPLVSRAKLERAAPRERWWWVVKA